MIAKMRVPASMEKILIHAIVATPASKVIFAISISTIVPKNPAKMAGFVWMVLTPLRVIAAVLVSKVMFAKPISMIAAIRPAKTVAPVLMV